jgi:hypothetical protein
MALHCIRLDCNAQPYSCIATDAGGWQLPGVAPYWVISFEITQGISVLRLHRNSVRVAVCRGVVYQGLAVFMVSFI